MTESTGSSDQVLARLGHPGLIHSSWGGAAASVDETWYRRWGFRDAKRWIILLVMVCYLTALGLTLAHAANNMVNDLFDYWQGTDTPDYPRANYAPHPILSGLVSTKGLIAAILICNFSDLAIAVYLYTLRGLPILYFAVAGLLTSVFYVAPPLKLKYRGFGELAIFIIWGPLMIAGTYYALAGAAPLAVWVNSIPYGLAVTAVLMGKHLDKAAKDRAKGVRTLPVVLGDQRARLLTQLMILAFYLSIAVLAGHGDLPWPTLLVILSLPKAVRFISILSLPAPETGRTYRSRCFGERVHDLPCGLSCRMMRSLRKYASPSRS